MKASRISLTLLPAVLIATACGTSSDSDPAAGVGVVVDTLANGVVHVRSAHAGTWGPGEGWRIEYLSRIGREDGSGPDVFGRVHGIAIDSNGRVYVLDSQAEAVRVFDADGSYVRTLGGPGQGPGELRLARGVAVDPADRVWVLDGGNFRYTVWDSDGTLIGTRERPIPYLPRFLNGNFDRERLVEFTGGLFREAGARSRYGFVRVGLEEPVDSFSGPQPPSPARFQVQPEPGGMAYAFPVPFAPEFHLAVGLDGLYWTATSNAFRFYEATLAGDTTRILEREFVPDPVTDRDIEEALDHDQVRHIRSLGGQLDLNRIPGTKPVFEWMTVDDSGHLLVGRVPPDIGRTVLDVFDPDGRYLGEVALPARVAARPVPVVRAATLWGVIRDEFDVDYVVGFLIEPR